MTFASTVSSERTRPPDATSATDAKVGTYGAVTDADVFNAMEMFEIVLEQANGPDPLARADVLAKLLTP